MIQKFLADRQREESANQNTINEYEGICSTFLRIVCDKPVKGITCDEFKNLSKSRAIMMGRRS